MIRIKCKMRVAICDDCNSCLAHIEKIINKRKDFILEYESFSNGQELRNYIYENEIRFDVYILDIEMPGMNGIELAKEIRKLDISALILFQTSHMSYIGEALDTFMFHYLEKPVDDRKLEDLLIKAHFHLKKTGKRFSFIHQKNPCSIPYKDIIYFEKDKRKVKIHTVFEIYETYASMKDILSRLEEDDFLEVSCSYIVNLEYVNKIKKDEVLLYNGSIFAIGRTKMKKVREKQFILFCR